MALWSLKGTKILIVDDFPEMRSTLRGMLLSYCADNITMAGTGEEAIELISNNRFDVVLCDYNLGDGKDGQQILEEAKHRNALPLSTVFIMITAENTVAMVMGALEYQPDDYLSKPFPRNVLQARLQKQMEKKKGIEDLSKALEQKNTSLAIPLCDKRIETNPRMKSELLKLKCDLLIQQQEYDTAKQICLGVLEQRAVQWARFIIGKIQFLQKDYDAAKATFEGLIAENDSFVAAYDWLAQVEQQLGQSAIAQEILNKAVAWSPKSVARQRFLAEVSEQNKDFALAETSRRKVIRTGKNSVLREATDYTKLAKVLVENDNSKEAIKTVELVKHEFKGDDQAALAVAVAKSQIYDKTGDSEKSKQACESAKEIYSKNPDIASNELAIDLAETLLNHGETETADQVTRQLAANNHDDNALLEEVNQVYKTAGKEDLAHEILADTRKMIISTNNKGVKLLEAGNIEESIALFEDALRLNPDNVALNLNAAQSYLLMMENNGKNPTLLGKARGCLDKIRDNQKIKQRFKTLDRMYWSLKNS